MNVKKIIIDEYNDYILEGLERFYNLKELIIKNCHNLIELSK